MSFAQTVDELKAKNPAITWHEIAQITGEHSGEQARSKYRRAKKRVRSEITPAAGEEDSGPAFTLYQQSMVEFLDKKAKVQVSWQELIDLATTNQRINHDLDDTQRTAEVHIRTDRPIGLTFTGDWHLGDGATDHIQWARDIETILANERMFMADLGDDRQNARNFRQLSVVLSQVLTPQQQAHLLRAIVDELTTKEKLLAKVDGNHDVEFDQRIFGEALQGYLLEKMKAPRFKNKGLLKLTVGKELYTILLFHKSRFSSIFRGAHGAYREFQMTYPADIIAGGHDHLPAFEMLNGYQLARDAGMPFGGLTYLIKCGTYQDSEYGWKYFHNGGRPMNTTVVLWPDEHRMQAFFNPADAVRFLNTF